MPPYEMDLGYWRAGVKELKDYLLSDQLFWPLSAWPPSGGVAYPQLTLGGLLLARARVMALAPEPDRPKLIQVDREMDAVRQRWRSAWGRKAAWEFSSRLNQWRNYLEDYRRDPESQAPFYLQEVRLRVILALLSSEGISLVEGDTELLAGLDRVLRTVFAAGEFIWEGKLSEGFPPDTFWFLYGELRG